MKMQCYSIRDSKAEAFGNPFFQATHGAAERSFTELVNDDKSMLFKYPDDFDLYYLGEFDDQLGCIVGLETPKHIVKAVNVRRSGELNSAFKRASEDGMMPSIGRTQ